MRELWPLGKAATEDVCARASVLGETALSSLVALGGWLAAEMAAMAFFLLGLASVPRMTCYQRRPHPGFYC